MLHIFERLAVQRMPMWQKTWAKDERRKLDLKTRKCILLGYGTETKGYRLYDPNQERLFHSRDVMFNEEKCGIEEESNGQDKRYVNIDSLCDNESVAEGEVESLNPDTEEETELLLRRSQRERQPPIYYDMQANITSGLSSEPKTVREARASPDKTKWMNAMEKEIVSLQLNNVWDLVEMPRGRKPVGSKWVFKLKVGADGIKLD